MNFMVYKCYINYDLQETHSVCYKIIQIVGIQMTWVLKAFLTGYLRKKCFMWFVRNWEKLEKSNCSPQTVFSLQQIINPINFYKFPLSLFFFLSSFSRSLGFLGRGYISSTEAHFISHSKNYLKETLCRYMYVYMSEIHTYLYIIKGKMMFILIYVILHILKNL